MVGAEKKLAIGCWLRWWLVFSLASHILQYGIYVLSCQGAKLKFSGGSCSTIDGNMAIAEEWAGRDAGGTIRVDLT